MMIPALILRTEFSEAAIYTVETVGAAEVHLHMQPRGAALAQGGLPQHYVKTCAPGEVQQTTETARHTFLMSVAEFLNQFGNPGDSIAVEEMHGEVEDGLVIN